MHPHNSDPLERGGPLHGVRVLELTKVWAGPYAGKLLGFLGAEVLKIESLNSLDTARYYGVGDINDAPGFRAVNPQKMSVQIDMKTAVGIDLIVDLIRHCDVVIENFRPGAAKRLGLGYEAIRRVKPDIVYVSMSMHGSEGPLSYQTGYAPGFSALSGVTFSVGYEDGPPTGMNVRYGDATFGATAAYAAVVALLHRRRTGLGQFVDVSAAESISSMIADVFMEFALTGNVPGRNGNTHPDMVPHGIYPCREKQWIAIAVSSQEQWRALADTLGDRALAEDTRFESLADRKANRHMIDRLIAAKTLQHDANALASELQRRGVAAAKSADSVDLVSDPQLWSDGFFPTVTDRADETRPVVGPSWRMSRDAAVVQGAPRLGEHTARVFEDLLGLSAEARQRLHLAKVTY